MINPFPYPSALQKTLLQELVDICQFAGQRGWSDGTSGNLSIRGSGNLMWMSPSGVVKRQMKFNSFLPAHLSYAPASMSPIRKLSAEAPLHAAIYLNDSTAQAVVHLHTPLVVQKTSNGESLDFSGPEMIKAFGVASHLEDISIPVVENSQDMIDLGAKFNSFRSAHCSAFVLRGHGTYAWGPTPAAALSLVEALEFLCA